MTALGALVQLPGPDGCLVSSATPARSCRSVRALRGPAPFLGSQAVTLSPDGRTLYVASSTSDAIAIFRRSTATGHLRQASGRSGCIAARGAGGCAHATGLRGPNSVAVSADGRSVYATSVDSDTVTAFRRDRRTGALTQVGCLAGRTSRAGCPAVRALSGPDVVRVSPDGRNVYVGSFTGNALVAFARNRSSGRLTQLSGSAGCLVLVAASGCATARMIGAPEGLAVSADGRNVYVAAANSSAVGVFARTASTGRLTQASGTAGCIVNTPLSGCATGVQLAGANAVAISPDDDDVYVTSLLSNSITSFTRAASGHLQQKSGTQACVIYLLAVGCSLGRAMRAPEGLAVSPDGAGVYAAAFTGNAIGVLDRDPSSGALIQKFRRPGCLVVTPIADCGHGRALKGVSSITVSPDGRFAYAAAFTSNAVTAFRRVTPPPPPPGRG